MAALHKLEKQDLGFEPDRRMVANIQPQLAGYSMEQLSPLYHRIQDALSSIPEVDSVALCTYSPQSWNNWGTGVFLDGHPPPGANDDTFSFWDRATAGYFDVIGTPILRGRGITEQDTSNSRHIAVINEAFARKFFKSEDPLGKHFGRDGIGSERQYEIVGITKDARYLHNFSESIRSFFFLPESQHDFTLNNPSKEVSPGSHILHDIVIVTKPRASLSESRVRQAIASVDPNLPIGWIHTLKEQVSLQFTQQRLIARLTSFFGLLSLLLASIGLYGVSAYNAGRRTAEIGVRMALGADRKNVLALVLRGAFMLILLGLIIGLPLTFGRFLGSQLYGTNPYNPFVTFGAVFALALSALIASLIPAFRASRISPLDALRAE